LSALKFAFTSLARAGVPGVKVVRSATWLAVPWPLTNTASRPPANAARFSIQFSWSIAYV